MTGVCDTCRAPLAKADRMVSARRCGWCDLARGRGSLVLAGYRRGVADIDATVDPPDPDPGGPQKSTRHN